jgi:hypothetical protein
MVRLMTAANAMEARIIGARLGSEGIVWEFRGSVDGPFAIGPVEVLVDADGFDSAKELLQADHVGSEFAAFASPVRVTTGRDVLWALFALVAFLLFAIVRVAVA